MTDLTVVERPGHCEIHQGDAIAADCVATKRLAALFAAAPDLLYHLKQATRLLCEHGLFDWEDQQTGDSYQAMVDAIRLAEGKTDDQ